jgi:hypothetical protein
MVVGRAKAALRRDLGGRRIAAALAKCRVSAGSRRIPEHAAMGRSGGRCRVSLSVAGEHGFMGQPPVEGVADQQVSLRAAPDAIVILVTAGFAVNRRSPLAP